MVYSLKQMNQFVSDNTDKTLQIKLQVPVLVLCTRKRTSSFISLVLQYFLISLFTNDSVFASQQSIYCFRIPNCVGQWYLSYLVIRKRTF